MEVMKQLKAEVDKKKDRLREEVDKKKDRLMAEVEKKKEVMQHLREELDDKKQMMHDFKDGVEEVVEEVLLAGRRRRARSLRSDDNSTNEDDSVRLDNSSSFPNSNMEGRVVVEEGDNKEEKSVYYDDVEGNALEWSHLNVKGEDLGAKLKDVDINQVLGTIISGEDVNNLKDKLTWGSNLPISTKPQQKEDGTSSKGLIKKENEHAEVDEMEESDEEVIELEFERAVEKIHTHHEYTMHCPNCKSRITKVVLRRKIRQRRIPISSDNQRDDLVGCLSCFRIFIPSGNKLNPFRIFGAGREPESTPLLQQQHTPDVSLATSSSTQVQVRFFDLFWIFGRRGAIDNASNPQQLPPATHEEENNNAKRGLSGKAPLVGVARVGPVGILPQPIAPVLDMRMGNEIFDVPGKLGNDNAENSKPPPEAIESNGVASVAPRGNLPQPTPPVGFMRMGNVIINAPGKIGSLIEGVKNHIKPGSEIEGALREPLNKLPDVRIPIPIGEEEEKPAGEVNTQIPHDPTLDPRPLLVPESQSSRSVEIVKSVVYGGLVESMTSLSVVSSAAASDATTLNIVALGLANLVGGLVVLAHNLRDLRYGDSNESNEQKYKEELGRKEHFLLHATVAVLSYLVFGLMPPAIYGFTFRETDDRDFKMLAVAVASLLCIIILATMKAYARGEHKFMTYFKTIVYYVTATFMVSGIAFAVGDLIHKVIEGLGWFNPSTVEPQLFSGRKLFNPTSRASY